MALRASDAVTALLEDLRGAGDDALRDTVSRLPVSLAVAMGQFLAGQENAGCQEAARCIFEQLRPLFGQTVTLDDDLTRLALALRLPVQAEELARDRLTRSEAVTAYQLVAQALLEQDTKEKRDEAAALADMLARDHGSKQTAWLTVGQITLSLGDAERGATAYRRALELAPNSVSALLGLARAAAFRGDEEEARTLLARVFAAYQDNPSAWVVRETVEVAARLADADWLADLRDRQAELAGREAERLRARLAAPEVNTGAGSGASPTTGQRARRGGFGEQRVGTVRGDGLRVNTPGEDELDGNPAEAATEAKADDEPAAAELLDALREHFGYEGFLPGQATIIAATLRGEDVLAVMPTGAGKSLCYQLPSLLLPGTTVLISPLIALMKDQMDNLPATVRERTTIINSLVERDELERRLAGIAEGHYKLVYAAPERLRQQSFIYALRRAGIARFVVDEAHCVSLWGHDFRPDYLFIAKVLRQLEAGGVRIPVLALTATATPEVRAGIAEALERDLRVVNRGVFRPNLRYEVVNVGNNEDRKRALARILQETPGAGIVYVRSRDGCEEVAEFLRRRCHITATHYHAGMDRASREGAQEAFIAGRVRVVVATVAFGMGIDKADVRFIAHYQLPGSLEAYVQESGRAGRDGKPSRCVLFASTSDMSLMRRHVRQDELSIETLRAVYAAVRGLVRAGLPTGATAGRVVAADLEREVSTALAASKNGGEVDETGARIALSMLERCGFLIRHPDVPRSPTVRLLTDSPASQDADSGSLSAFVASAHLRPRQSQQLDLVALAAQLGDTPAALEERLLSWRDAGYVEYRDGTRDLLLELAPAPSDGKTRLPELLEAVAERHERQVASLVAYSKAMQCRQRAIARHFGERLPVAACGECDRCAGVSDALIEEVQSHRRPRTQPIRDVSAVRETIHACLRDLPYAVGMSGLVRILRGSADTAPSAARSPQFGALAAIGRDRLNREIQAMVAEGLLERDDSGEYPLLRIPEA